MKSIFFESEDGLKIEEGVFEGSSHAQNMLIDPIILEDLKEEITEFLLSL